MISMGDRSFLIIFLYYDGHTCLQLVSPSYVSETVWNGVCVCVFSRGKIFFLKNLVIYLRSLLNIWYLNPCLSDSSDYKLNALLILPVFPRTSWFGQLCPPWLAAWQQCCRIYDRVAKWGMPPQRTILHLPDDSKVVHSELYQWAPQPCALPPPRCSSNHSPWVDV